MNKNTHKTDMQTIKALSLTLTIIIVKLYKYHNINYI